MPIYKKVNENFFDQWTPEMAYVLGFIYADGYVHANKRGSWYLGFVSTDREIIEKIRTVLGSEHVISIRHRNYSKWKDLFRLQIGNMQFRKQLHKLGVFQNKSLKIRFPKIPNKYIGDFVRGYFDGDGCVYFNQHKVKGRKNMKWIFQTLFVSGSRRFLLDLRTFLPNDVHGGYIVRKKRGYQLNFSHKDSLALYRLMYNNVAHGLFLCRKYKKFTFAIKTLYGPVAQLVRAPACRYCSFLSKGESKTLGYR